MWVQSACRHAALSTVGKAPAALTRGQAAPAPASPAYAGWAGGAGGGAGVGTAAPQTCCGCSPLRVGPGFLAAGVQVLPAEAGVHGVADRAAGVGGAQAASPQLRPQLPALGGRIIRCSCASQPAREPVPHRNGGSPVLPRQRSTWQGQ